VTTPLKRRLRLLVVTRPDPACGRGLAQVVAECVEAGATAIELRDKSALARELLEQADVLVNIVQAAGALFLVNDRLDVALACGADGVHLGPEDIPIGAARQVVPPGFLIGYSTDDPVEAATAAADGADYLGVGAVYGTLSKEGLADEAIGPARIAEVLAAADLPGVGIGGITPESAAEVARTGAGIAVLGAVMNALEPAEVVRELLRAIG
jgi:thiamine-phosphate diphosphorylase